MVKIQCEFKHVRAITGRAHAVLGGIHKSSVQSWPKVDWAEFQSHKLLVMEGQRLPGLQPGRLNLKRVSALNRGCVLDNRIHDSVILSSKGNIDSQTIN